MQDVKKSGAADVIHADFTSFLKQVNKGQTEAELSQVSEEVVAAVKETGKPGVIMLKITIAPATKGEVNQVFVDADIVKKVPRKPRGQTLFFTTRRNTLVRTNPDQTEMPFVGEEK